MALILSYLQQASGYQFVNDRAALVKGDNARTRNAPRFPPEIILIILENLVDDKKALAACALVDQTFNLHATPILYSTVSFTFPKTFMKFANSINGASYRTGLIRYLDLSGFSTFGLQKSHVATQKLVTSQVLIHILQSSPNLEGFSVSESLESAINVDVLRTLVFGCRKLKALDFAGCSGKQFSSAMEALVTVMGRAEILQYQTAAGGNVHYEFQRVREPALAHIKRLSFHECPVLSEYTTIISLLGHAPNLTHLDLGGCSVSDSVLYYLADQTNATLTLTHLSLAKCKSLSSDAIAAFISKCVKLEHLNLYGNREVSMSISEWDLMTILSSPSAKRLRTLDIGSSQVNPRVLHAIQQNCSSELQHLGLDSADITTSAQISTFLAAMPHIQYIDLTNVSCLNSLNTNGFIAKINKNPKHQLRTIEMSESLLKKLHAIKGWKIDQNYTRRWYYARESRIGAPRADRMHSRKLDVLGNGVSQMSNIFQYYSFGL